MKQVRCRSVKASGAALTECFFLTIILVPLLFGTAMLGKQIDLSQRAVMASRYTVWETTVGGGDSVATDVRRRFFERSVGGGTHDADDGRTAPHGIDAGLSGDAVAAGASDTPASGPDGATGAENRPPTAGGMRAQTEVAVRAAGIGARYDDTGGRGVAGAVGKAVNTAGNAIAAVSGGTWELAANGMTRGTVGIPVEANGWLAGRTLEERSVIMNDGWSASGLTQLNSRTRSLVPAGGLESVANALSNAGLLPLLKELKGLDGAFGRVDASALPLPEIRTLQPYAERAR